MNLPQIRDFQVRFINGQTIYEPIENIQELYNILRVYGRSYLAKISFYFHTSNNNFHNLILRNDESYNNDRFTVEFCSRYDDNMQRIEMTNEEKHMDFQAVINILESNNFNNNLIPYIINPFIEHNSNIQN
jgi:hypothetical protein